MATQKPKRPKKPNEATEIFGATHDRIAKLEQELQKAQIAQRDLARTLAKRTDQMRALLQVANMLLWVASRETGIKFREAIIEKLGDRWDSEAE
jgi:citrate lyase beta subunit